LIRIHWNSMLLKILIMIGLVTKSGSLYRFNKDGELVFYCFLNGKNISLCGILQ
jgi:hypothetical protein